MLAISGVYDNGKIEFLNETPVTGKRSVIVIFPDEPVLNVSCCKLNIDPITALRGCAKGIHLTEKLLASRQEDVKREESKWKR